MNIGMYYDCFPELSYITDRVVVSYHSAEVITIYYSLNHPL